MNKELDHQISELFDKYKNIDRIAKELNLDYEWVLSRLKYQKKKLRGVGAYKKSGEVLSKEHAKLGTNITLRRLELNYQSAADLAPLIGMGKRKLKLLEFGVKDITLTELLKISKILKLKPSEILEGL